MLPVKDFAFPIYILLFTVFSCLPPRYVCSGREHRITSPSSLRYPKKQGLAAVEDTRRKGRGSKQKRRSRSLDGRERQKGTSRRRRRGSEGGGHSGLQSPISELEEPRRDGERSRSRRRRRKRETRSLPRDAFRNNDDSETEKETVAGRTSKRERGRSKKRGTESKSEERARSEEAEGPEQKEEQGVAAVEERVEERMEELEERVDSERKESKEDVFLHVPSLNQKLPRPKQDWEVESQDKWEVVSRDNWEVAAEYREMRKEEEMERPQGEDRGNDGEIEEEDPKGDVESVKRPLPGVDVLTEPFSFLTSTLSMEQFQDDESESGGSQSDVSTASVSGFSLANSQAGGRRANLLPGPWLKPSQQRLDEATEGGMTGQGPGRSAIS